MLESVGGKEVSTIRLPVFSQAAGRWPSWVGDADEECSMLNRRFPRRQPAICLSRAPPTPSTQDRFHRFLPFFSRRQVRLTETAE